MFKNLFLYRIKTGSIDLVDAGYRMSQAEFMPCGATQEKSIGWVSPRAKNGKLIESVGNQWIAKLRTETKAVPADVVNRKTTERVAQIEASTGRKPGKKGLNGLKC